MKKILTILFLIPFCVFSQTPTPSLDTTYKAKALRATSLLMADNDVYFTKYANSDATLFAGFDAFGKLILRTITGGGAATDTSFLRRDINLNTAAIITKQATLISGSNIKTINGSSLLGSGDLVITGGGGSSNWTVSGLNIYNNNTGNVGVGTTNPLSSFHVENNTFLKGNIDVGVRYNDANVQLSLQSDRSWLFNMYRTGGVIATSLMQNGNFGIGTSTPTEKFHVIGNARVTDLASGLTAPTTTGLTKMVTVDANGLFSNAAIPSGGGTPTYNRTSVLFANASGIPTGDSTKFYYANNFIYIGSSAELVSGVAFNGANAEINGQSGGMRLNIGIGDSPGTYDVSKSYIFRNKGNNYLTMSSSAATGGFNTADFNAVVKTAGYTVATLPAGTIGMTAYVTDATSPTYLGALTGGGTIKCPVFFNGAQWVSH